MRLLPALLSRREAIAQDLQRERYRREKADATDTPPLIRQSLVDSIAFLENNSSSSSKRLTIISANIQA